MGDIVMGFYSSGDRVIYTYSANGGGVSALRYVYHGIMNTSLQRLPVEYTFGEKVVLNEIYLNYIRFEQGKTYTNYYNGLDVSEHIRTTILVTDHNTSKKSIMRLMDKNILRSKNVYVPPQKKHYNNVRSRGNTVIEYYLTQYGYDFLSGTILLGKL